MASCPDRQADLIDISSASDIHNTEFDDPSTPISPGGTLDATINPATYVSFVSFIDDTQLARFGLHNGECISFPFSLFSHVYLFVLSRQASRSNSY